MLIAIVAFQKMLSRHVNQHFSANEEKAKKPVTVVDDGNPYNVAKKSSKPSMSPLDKAKAGRKDDSVYLARKSAYFNPTKKFSSSTKNLKRAGIRLKYRQGGIFSARNFDFFDPSIMPGLRHSVYLLENKSYRSRIDSDLYINFVGKIVAVKSDLTKRALVRWSPENL